MRSESDLEFIIDLQTSNNFTNLTHAQMRSYFFTLASMVAISTNAYRNDNHQMHAQSAGYA